MLQLTALDEELREINDLTGLEYATNLRKLALNQNQITDLSPLSNLIHLQNLAAWGNPISDLSPLSNLTQLRVIGLAGCDIADVEPLSNLTQLEDLNLGWNDLIQDISPLSNLTNLTHLRLTRNQIVDISPLANLTQLKYLSIDINQIIDFSPLDGLSLIRLVHDEACELPPLPIEPRIKNRTFPSIFAAWAGRVPNRPELSDAEHIALHDLYWEGKPLDLHFIQAKEGWWRSGSLEKAQALRDAYLDLNPNMIFIVEVRMRDASLDLVYDENFPYWLRDTNGNMVEISPGSNYYLIDFTQPGMQDRIVQQAIAVAKCGLFDGIFLDWWKENHPVIAHADSGWDQGYVGFEVEQNIRDNIMQRIRSQVRDDFLILGNTNRAKIPRTAWSINGTFMETGQDYPGGYTHDGLKEIESTLLWSEENLREPQVNCLEGFGIPTEPPDSPNNLRFMRLFTTMSLTCSDGYVVYNTGNTHQHIWYSFWDADLGYPIGTKAQQYQNVEGAYIREFTNGWAVYNRSGNAQIITLPASATPVSDRGQAAASLTHQLPDLDGEIYLKTRNPADVNGDWAVNILDLVQVANSFGKSTPDPNGDGTVNILDLVFVAQAFSQ